MAKKNVKRVGGDADLRRIRNKERNTIRKEMGREKLIRFKQWGLMHISYIGTVVRWSLGAVVAGVVCGLIGVGFDRFLELASDTFVDFPWLFLFLPLGGILIVALYRLCRVEKDSGFQMILASVKTEERVPYLCAPLVFLCTGVTHFLGGSSGREGAALQIGGTAGLLVGKGMHFRKEERDILALCGMSAIFSAVFGTPITAAVLSIEVVSMGSVYYMAFLPCVLSALIAYQISCAFGVTPTAKQFGAVEIPGFDGTVLGKVLLLALFFSVVTILFVSTVKWMKAFFHRVFRNEFVRILAGGCFLVVLTGVFYYVTGSFDYNGAGMAAVVRAVNGLARPGDFLVKIIFTAVTLGCGYKGGQIVPGFFIGATAGCVAGSFFGLNAGFAAALGMIALFSGMDNCPLAAMMLAVELFGAQFGAEGFIYFAVVCAVSYMLTGYFSLYSGRECTYSSLHRAYVYKKVRDREDGQTEND